MSTATIAQTLPASSFHPTIHPLSLTQYHAMIDGGILTEQDAVEFIEGKLVQKMVIGSRHAACVKLLNRLFERCVGDMFIVGIQDPVIIGDSQPEPDLAVLDHRDDFYASGHPTADNIQLLIEVSDKTLQFDREIKMPLYARGGVPEYWIINLIDDVIEVHREPRPEGRYGTMQTFERGQTVSGKQVAGLVLPVTDVLGPESAGPKAS